MCFADASGVWRRSMGSSLQTRFPFRWRYRACANREATVLCEQSLSCSDPLTLHNISPQSWFDSVGHVVSVVRAYATSGLKAASPRSSANSRATCYQTMLLAEMFRHRCTCSGIVRRLRFTRQHGMRQLARRSSSMHPRTHHRRFVVLSYDCARASGGSKGPAGAWPLAAALLPWSNSRLDGAPYLSSE